MHISDSVPDTWVWIAGYGATGLATGWALWRAREEEIPRTAVMTSVFFAASYIHIPLPPPGGSVHLILNGLMGIVLGWQAFPAIFIALAFQLLLLGHGGVTTLGINTFNMAAGAIAARYLFAARGLLSPSRLRDPLAGLVAGAAAIGIAGVFYFGCLLSAGEAFQAAARIAFILHLPVMAVEALITTFAVTFLARVKPSLLDGRCA